MTEGTYFYADGDLMVIVLLGAPSNQLLQQTWDPKMQYSQLDAMTPGPACAAWRLLSAAHNSVPAHDLEVDHTALETSYAMFCDIDEPLHLETVTQLPEYEFNMSVVKDIEDLYHVPLLDKNDKPRLYSTLCAVLSISAPKNITTKAGNLTQVVILTLGDHTSSPLELAAWGSHAQYVLKFVQRLDVLLIEDFVLSMFHTVLGGTSRASRTHFTILYRTMRRTAYDDQFRPFLVDDPQSTRVRRVRDWALAWVPGETQPEYSNTSIFSLR